MIDRSLAIIDLLARLAAWLAGALLAGLFLIGLLEILARALFAASLGFALEYSGYLVAQVLLLGSAHAITTGGHIRITLVLERLPDRARASLDLAATLAGLLAAAALAAALIRYAVTTAQLGARSYFPTATPLWIPQGLFALGPCLLALALLARLVRLVRGEDPGA